MNEVLGFGSAIVIGAGWMLRYLMTRMTKRDEFIETLTSNHIAHSTEALVKLTEAINELKEVIKSTRPEDTSSR